VYGFPLAGYLARGNFTVGTVTALSGFGGDTRVLQISAPVQIGNSGGPVLDQFGNIIGVVVSKLTVFFTAETLKDLPQNVNFAIKAATAISFLEANNVRPKMLDSTEPISPADIAERAKSFTAQVICHPNQQAQSTPEPPRAPAPPAQKTLRLRVVQNLNLRAAPDPLSDKVVLGTPPNDAIPKDAIVELRYTSLNDACRRYGASSAVPTIWCPVNYEGHGGWVKCPILGHGKWAALVLDRSNVS
jgi:S1-C subfamily serine protease